ncbi:hypothetical protein [Gordonia neofelifaecis]|uniref:Uncharacterized protein n=1 Tax=Gordonia neofelifaecis NRRL B-59395 TaxID=644548 RepID=F1YEB4_9ACTN|nr:hypothetical protein [Gordonia neofelifaecis]EGD56747.1 hypothetical protein SCNU_00175 [Gordonia neofelifaecis NRRL B-59395]
MNDVPAALLNAAPDDRDAEQPDVWASTPELQHIRDAAQSRLMAPAAVLGAVLARRLAEVPPNIQLPPVIGDEQSLNFYTLAYGPPASGRSASDSVAAKLLGPSGVEWTPLPASGEKLAGTFVTPDSNAPHGVRFVRRTAYLAWDEVLALRASAERNGSTLLASLLSAWPGKGIGTTTQTRDRNTPVPPHSYRLCAFLGVQPANADALLAGAKDGLPQRFLWMATEDPTMPARTLGGGDIVPLRLADIFRFDDPQELGQVQHVEVCEAARDSIVAARLNVVRGHGEPASGHRLLLQEKVASGLSLLRPDCDMPIVDDASWHLAGRVMSELHDPTFTRAIKDRSREERQRVQHLGHLDEERAAAAETSAVKRVAERLDARMPPTGMTVTDINRAVAGRDKARNLHRDAREWLVNTARWVKEDGRYFRASEQ